MSKKSELNLWQRTLVEILVAVCWVLSRLPHFVLYWILAPFIYFVVYRLIGYRRRVVDENLTRCFPDLSDSERAKIRSDFYVVFSEVIVSSLSKCNIGENQNIVDPSDTEELRAKYHDRSWVALTAHFGMWEYLSVWSHFANQLTIAVYHPLANKFSNELFQRLRKEPKILHLPAKESIRFTIANGLVYNGGSYALGLIADQNPPHLPDSHWFSFMGQDTIFFDGGERIARRLKMPVAFVYQSRTGRGHYKLHYRDIWDGVESIEPYEITRRYAEELEREIRKAPHLWLWTHRRWKAQRNNVQEKWVKALK